MRPPRGLTEEEAQAWARLASTVTALKGRKLPAQGPIVTAPAGAPVAGTKMARVKPASQPSASPVLHTARTPQPRPIGTGGLDSHWDRRLKTGAIEPDFTLDLHGHGLDAAHGRLEHGIAQARAMGARLVLVVTGKPRPVDAADRATRRGAIRSKILDWLAAGQHADAIAAIRKSHRRHGGDGAIYIVLRR